MSSELVKKLLAFRTSGQETLDATTAFGKELELLARQLSTVYQITAVSARVIHPIEPNISESLAHSRDVLAGVLERLGVELPEVPE